MTTRTYGVTEPISLANPTPKENSLNDSLIAELKVRGSFESELATRRRGEVLAQFQKMAQEFVYTVSKSKNMSDGMAKDAGGKVFTYGSYRLGVYSPGSDIDTLVVVPKHVLREDFFTVFEQILRRRPELQEITSVPDSFVPIIKIEFDGISIDLIMARLNVTRVPIDMTLDDKNLLKNLDERDMRSLNGTRVTDEILQLVPKPTVFKHSLRCVKMWAQNRAVYGNIFGFPGGVAWAMLVARICQLYPNAVSAVVVEKFFNIYMKWNWPQPVLLKPIENGPLQVRVWNPRLYPQDRLHKMPVITPAYPSMCATHNITSSTQKVIQTEIERGSELMHQIRLGNKTWAHLFERHSFFFDHKFYLCVVAATVSTAEEHLKWCGFVESRLRHLVLKLEVTDGVQLARPYVKDFTDRYLLANVSAEDVICASGTSDGASILKGLTAPDGASVNNPQIHLTRLYIGLDVKVSTAQSDGVKKLDIQYPCSEFYSICKGWQSFNENIHRILIKTVKLANLPDDVYVVGEAKPTKSNKRKKNEIKEDTHKRPRSGASLAPTLAS